MFTTKNQMVQVSILLLMFLYNMLIIKKLEIFLWPMMLAYKLPRLTDPLQNNLK